MENQVNENQESADSSAQKIESSKEHAKKAVDDFIGAGTAKAQEYSAAMAQQAQQYKETAKAHMSDWRNRAESYARAKPTEALATALGVGFVLGILFRR